MAGKFTFGPAGVADVAGYLYGDQSTPTTYVPADRIGGSATIDYAPTSIGGNWFYVISVDRAGHRSPTRQYLFWVRNNTPLVSSTPERGRLGVPMEFTFAPQMDDVVEYSYQLNGGEVRTIAAGPDRTAQVTLAPNVPTPNTLAVRSRTSAGVWSGENAHFIGIDLEQPTVTSVEYPEDPFEGHGGPGIAGTFEFSATLADVADYAYTLDGGPQAVVVAGADGRASISITPTTGGWHLLTVRARRADGITSMPYEYYFLVND